MLGMGNNYLKGVDEYPKTLTAAYSLLTNWKQDTRSLARLANAGCTGIAFNTVKGKELESDGEEGTTLATAGRKQNPQSGNGGKDKSHIKCFRCGKMGHFANGCTAKIDKTEEDQDEGGDDQSGTQLLMAAAASGNLSDDDHSGFFFYNEGKSAMNYKRALMSSPPVPKDGRSAKESTVPKGSECVGSADYEHLLSQTWDKKVDPNWILLDNQSTVDLFYNPNMLENIRE
jgi:hypothetical protein